MVPLPPLTTKNHAFSWIRYGYVMDIQFTPQWMNLPFFLEPKAPWTGEKRHQKKKNAFPHLQDLVPDVLRRGDRMNDSTSWGVAKPQAKEMEGPKTSSLKMNQTWKETIPGIQENNPKSWLRKCFSQKHSSFWGSHVEKNRPHHVHLQWPWIRGFFFNSFMTHRMKVWYICLHVVHVLW